MLLTFRRSCPPAHHIEFRSTHQACSQTQWDRRSARLRVCAAHPHHQVQLRISRQPLYLEGASKRVLAPRTQIYLLQNVRACCAACMPGAYLKVSGYKPSEYPKASRCVRSAVPCRLAYSCSEISNFSTCDTSENWPARDAPTGFVSVTFDTIFGRILALLVTLMIVTHLQDLPVSKTIESERSFLLVEDSN